jgi:hypothetical protein
MSRRPSMLTNRRGHITAMSFLWSFYSRTVRVVSAECLLDKRANGGDVVLARAVLISTLLFVAGLGISEALRETASWVPSFGRFQFLILENFEWFAAMFSGAYLALYSRFAAQWGYLAGLYNTIMASSMSVSESDEKTWSRLCTWWAAFIEDADDLHLATKPMFASVIEQLLSEERWKEVVTCFDASSPGGGVRRRQIHARVRAALISKKSRSDR